MNRRSWTQKTPWCSSLPRTWVMTHSASASINRHQPSLVAWRFTLGPRAGGRACCLRFESRSLRDSLGARKLPLRQNASNNDTSPLQKIEEDGEVRSPSHNRECCNSNGSNTAEIKSMKDNRERGTQIGTAVLISVMSVWNHKERLPVFKRIVSRGPPVLLDQL